MAKKISSSDLFEQEDLFKGVRDSATKTIEVFNQLQSELKETAQGLKSELTANTQASTAQLKQFSAASDEANKLMKQSVEIEKLKAQADQQRLKAEAELVKLQKLQAQEAERAVKSAEKQAAAQAKLAREQEKEVGTLNKLEAANKKLRAERQQLDLATSQGRERLKEINTELDRNNNFIKQNSDALKQQKLNVGNYAGALEGLEQQVAEGNMSMREMTKAIKQFQTIALQAGETSPVGKQAIANAAQLKDRISDLNNRVKLLSSDTVKLDTALAAIGVSASAFQGIQGAMALAGGASEEFQQALIKLQAVQMVSNSIQQITNALNKDSILGIQLRVFWEKAQALAIGKTTGALKNLRLAMAATGVGALIAGIGLLIANWDKLTSKEKFNYEEFQKTQALKLEILRAQQESLQRQYNLISKSSDNAIKGIEREIQIAELQGKNTDELYKRRAKLIQETSEESIKATEEERQSIKDRMRELERDNGKVLTNHKGYLENKAKLDSDAIRTEGEKKWRARHVAAYEEAKALRERAYELKAFRESEFDKAEAAEDELKIMKLKKEKEIRDKIKEQRNADLNELKAYIKEANKLTSQTQMDDTEKAVDEVRRKYERQLALAKKYGKGLAEIEIAMMNEINNIHLAKVNEQIEQENEAREQARLNRIRLENEMLDEIEQLSEEVYRLTLTEQENELRDLEEWYFEKKELFKDNADALIDLEILYLNKKNDINLQYQDNEESQDEKNAKKKADALKKNFELSKEYAQKTTDFFKKQSEERIALIDKEISAAEKQADIYRELAANGNINAEQSLAEQERIIAESNRRKEREMKRQQRMELANTIYQTYAGHAAQDPKTALANTIRDASLLQAFISTLPMFYEGTEDTGAGGGVDGKGGFHAVLHPHERVIPKSLNDQIGSLTNEQLTRLATDYQNGRLIGKDTAHSSLELAIMVNELRELKDVIKHKPETNIQLGEITQSAMEIVQSTKQGNTTVYNRFKVRK